MSNFSFSHSVFKRLVSQGCQKVSLCGNGLIKGQKCRLIQIESICRQQFECGSNSGIRFFYRVENIVGKGENAGMCKEECALYGFHIFFVFQYAQETQHEKILRGLAIGISLTMYGRLEEADALIESLCRDKDPILRWSGMYTIGMAYCGSGNNQAIRRLLHVAVRRFFSFHTRQHCLIAISKVFAQALLDG